MVTMFRCDPIRTLCSYQKLFKGQNKDGEILYMTIINTCILIFIAREKTKILIKLQNGSGLHPCNMRMLLCVWIPQEIMKLVASITVKVSTVRGSILD